jgi:hypothetical protein
MKMQAEQDGPSGKGERLMLCGVLIPSGWDDKGRIERVALATRDERELLILSDPMGETAVGLVREEVEIEGFLESGPEGPVLRVVEIRSVE